MRIAVSTFSQSLNTDINPRFGRCTQFLVFDVDLEKDINYSTLLPKLLHNPAINAAGGAGIQAAQMIMDEKIQAVITGNLGPNAARVLSSDKVIVYQATGKILDALRALQQGNLPEFSGASVPGHHGIGMGRGGGMGRNR